MTAAPNPRRRVLMICGSMNQTTQMHAIARCFPPHYDVAFTPYYGPDFTKWFRRFGWLEATIGGNRLRRVCLDYLSEQGLPVDLDGANAPYDLVFTCSDLLVPWHHFGTPIVLVQEGMTDDPNLFFPLIKRWGRWLPRWIGGTAATGLSGLFDRFCVASEGYRDLFETRGVPQEKLVVTGIPNFDNVVAAHTTDVPHRNYVLVCTSDTRETYGREDRRATVERAKEIAQDRLLIFKLHPNENRERAREELRRYAPDALVYEEGAVEPLIAHCDVLITRFSSVVFVGLALGKEVYSDFPMERLRRLQPIQNGGTSARNIACVAMKLLGDQPCLPCTAQPSPSPSSEEQAA